MISLLLGNPLPLRLQIDDGASDKFVKAHIFNGSNVLVNSVVLGHLVNGLYVGYYTPSTVGVFHSVYVLYTDNTYTTVLGPYYKNSSDSYLVQSINDIGEAVWNTDISDNNITNSAAKILKNIDQNILTIDANTLADAVWNKTTTDFNLPNTFGLLLNVVKLTVLNMENELNSNTDGLEALHDHITNQAQSVISEVNQNEGKIDQIIPAISSSQSALSSEHGAITLLLQSMSTDATQNKNAIINEVLTNRSKINEVETYVLSLTNNTTVRFVVPEQIIKPTTGTKTYQFYLRLFDDTGHPQAPDSAPTIVVKDIITLGVTSGTMFQDGVKVGAYYFDYTVASGSPSNPLFIEATVVENGVTRYVPATSVVTEYTSDLGAIQSQLNLVDSKVSDSQSKINNGVFGLQALQAQLTNVDNDVLSVKSGVTAIKSVTDALPTNIATTTDIAGVMTSINALPTLSQISNLLTLTKQAIMGASGISNTDTYNKIDFTGIMHSSDPRLNFLDANISSRSTLTANDVWTFATRTLTAISIPSVEAKKIWDVLTTDVSSFGSFGSLVKTMLDAAVSSRATQGQVSTLLNGVAQETSLGSVLSTLAGEINQNEVKINTIINLLNTIGPDVLLIKNTKSLETTVTNQTTAISNTLNSLNLLIQAIKISTDKIPADPAKESSVTLRPTNPLLNNDSRLLTLDSKISTRSTLKIADIAPLATNAQVAAETITIVNALGTVLNAINNVLVNIDPIPTNTEMDSKLSSLSSLSAMEAAKNEIISAISHISSSGSGASAADIWAHPSRTITGTVKIDPAELADIAKSDEVDKYTFNVNTSLLNGHQTVFVSITDNTHIISVNDIVVTVKKSDGTPLWSTTSSPNADGVHVVTSPVALITNSVYYVHITASIDNNVVTNTTPFTTVG